MRKEDYDLMHGLESDFWWFVGMREVAVALLHRYLAGKPRDILDVGCGTGINLLWASEKLGPERVVGCDFSTTALDLCRQTIWADHSSARKSIPRLCQGDIRRLPFAGGSFDMVTSFDVLDVFSSSEEWSAGMSELHRILRPDGLALVREPAYNWLLSSHDTLFGTHHRFTITELRRQMAQAGFEVVFATYANTLLFPLAMTQRLLRKTIGLAKDKTDTQPWPKPLEWLNRPFKWLMHLEAIWLERGRMLPFGLSAICVGRKQA